MANSALDRATQQARALKRTLEEVYQVRDSGERLSASQLKELERLVEDMATHPAFASASTF